MENFRLLPGLKFEPTDEELIVHYLRRKVRSLPLPSLIPEADVSRSDPWNLPGNPEQERYFFSTIETKYASGTRANRTTESGFWKASGKERPIISSLTKQPVGAKKVLVFYKGRSQNGSKTNWVLHEFKISNPTQGVQSWVLCKILLKTKPRNGGDGRLGDGPKNFDLNKVDGTTSSSGSNVVIIDADGDEQTSREMRN